MMRTLLLVLSGCFNRCAVQAGPGPVLPVSRHALVVIAHRADHEHAPENTVAAIRDAIRCGVDYVELDLRTTRDGYLVLSHDASVDRMTGAHGRVADMTLAEIKELVVRSGASADAGSGSGRSGASAAGGLINRIPEFREVLEACRGKMNIYLDFKEADVAETCKQIRVAGMGKRVVVYLNKPGQYEQWRAIAPQIPLMTSLPDSLRSGEGIVRFLAQKRIAVLDNVYDTALQRVVRQKGVALWLDAESEKEAPADWEALLAQPIQGIQTDHPEELMEYLRMRKVVPGRHAD